MVEALYLLYLMFKTEVNFRLCLQIFNWPIIHLQVLSLNRKQDMYVFKKDHRLKGFAVCNSKENLKPLFFVMYLSLADLFFLYSSLSNLGGFYFSYCFFCLTSFILIFCLPWNVDQIVLFTLEKCHSEPFWKGKVMLCWHCVDSNVNHVTPDLITIGLLGSFILLQWLIVWWISFVSSLVRNWKAN